MWQTNKGPCRCHYCNDNKEHPETHEKKFMTEWRGHLQKAESLDRRDILFTKLCSLCTHEVVDPIRNEQGHP